MIKTRFKPRTTNHEPRTKLGSALILAVVLTSLLAIIGVMFIMMARMDKMATSAISENKELNFAVETVVAKISQELVLDVPGMPKGSYYYDYPDANNAWLASLEPYKNNADNKYYWRQISDVTGFLAGKVFRTQDVNTEPAGLSTTTVVREYPEITLDGNGELREQSADADGDGIADSKWIQLDDITSDKGKPIYAAIRIVDNGGMVNINTAYKFDSNSPDPCRVDGSSQMQINLEGLLKPSDTINTLHNARCGIGDASWDSFNRNVVWQYGEPNGSYLPFDISDELELKYRYCIDSKVISRFEANLPDTAKTYGNPGGLYDGSSNWGLSDWQGRITDPNFPNDPCADRRHLLTTYNMDRIITPDCNKMTNINTADVNDLYSSIRKGLLDTNYPDVNGVAAQIAVNLIDFRDNDSNVTTLDVNGTTYYGFERPCVYVSELAYRFKTEFTPGGTGPGPGIPFTTYRSYAVELYKPYLEDDYPELNQWRLNIQGYTGGSVDVNWSGSEHFHVIYFEDSCCTPLPINFDMDTNFPSPVALTISINPNITVFTSGGAVSLQRKVGTGWISVDSIDVPPWLVDVPPGQKNPETTRSFKRDITLHKCIRRLWSPEADKDSQLSLGQRDPNYNSGDPNIIQAHPEDKPFTNIGEIGMLFRKDVYSDIVRGAVESDVRLNLADPNFQQLFKHLTIFDPNNFYPGDPNYANETRIKGRININTAPWYVLAQLPWVSQRIGGTDYSIAQAIVKYRDELKTPKGFESIGELMNVAGMDYYQTQAGDLAGFPDLTPGDSTGDGAADDFEERDVIFARISNLVTVRSDVFTAYILVRIGTDGPQKRVMAILDRSNVYSPTDKVRVVALHPVPDPR
ncbi:MAG: hypothetical protein ABSG99_08290 [Sedimentisphaerales bacterium]